MLSSLSFWDIAIILIYFGIILWIAQWASKSKSDSGSAIDYFLAGKNSGWLVIGASLFASNIGSEIILGVSGAGARGNMPMANFEIIASLVLILLGWVFVPFYLRTGVYTMPEFLEKRYSKACRSYLSVISILAYVVTKISLIIFAGALVFETIGIPFWTGAIITVVATGFYTVLGGLKAVIYTDMVQAFILLLGTIAVTIFGLYALGGWDHMIDVITTASAQEGNPPTEQFFNLWRPMADTEYPWTGMLFGAPILGVWYWCTDQYIVQRTLSAKDVNNARKGALFAGYLKLLPVFIFFIPGVIAYALLQEGAIEFSMENADQALPAMINGFLPTGLKGLAIAGLLAALMSSLSSAFNSSSTLLTIDFYQKYKPNATQKDLVRFGRLATIVLVVVSLGWIPFMKALMGGGIFHYLQSVQAYISPPIAAVFLFGLFYKWINAKGAIVSLWVGFVIGVFRLVAEFLANEGTIIVTQDSLLGMFLGINFLHFALFLFLFCAVILMVVSKIGQPQAAEVLELVTFQRRAERPKFKWSSDVTLTIILIGLVLLLWLLFSKWGIAG
ncbi:sodium/solute symporter [Maribacter algarum]|uniref:Sodium/solute symporter n=1 Tax=Maribacter algarum (ex Zhang et al. 2020) TaxID=2578118 RepID=A0A5S3PW07_9FLAO|nr:sodium:solute symporter [Maribacter algarum]TMM59206.1 sodium/solute symporter [Maribacter algarum]